ncbi:DUF1269 domain-containing protein [Bdellovibrio sp. HCB337]|uniref:DUF1269 domain-containing protein n=1 Tax=Bdellovibrio sp. HCB337 TaxID=3394358 RepID=UPI0039A54F15
MMTSTVMVLVYPEEQIADEVMDTIKDLQAKGLLEIEDACVVIKDPQNKVKIHQSHNIPLLAAAGGAVLGTLVGLIFAAPYVGAVVGVTAGVMGGALADVGIDDGFMMNVGHEMKAGNSALFLLLHHITIDKAIPELAKHGGKILHTSFSRVQEERVKKIFNSSVQHP